MRIDRRGFFAGVLGLFYKTEKTKANVDQIMEKLKKDGYENIQLSENSMPGVTYMITADKRT